MKIFIKAKPNSKKEGVEKVSENTFIVKVKEPPVDGKANKAIVEKMAEYFKVPVYRVEIVSGHTAKTKVLEISS